MTQMARFHAQIAELQAQLLLIVHYKEKLLRRISECFGQSSQGKTFYCGSCEKQSVAIANAKLVRPNLWPTLTVSAIYLFKKTFLGNLCSDFDTIAHCETSQGLQRILYSFVKTFKQTQEANFRPLTALKDVLKDNTSNGPGD